MLVGVVRTGHHEAAVVVPDNLVPALALHVDDQLVPVAQVDDVVDVHDLAADDVDLAVVERVALLLDGLAVDDDLGHLHVVVTEGHHVAEPLGVLLGVALVDSVGVTLFVGAVPVEKPVADVRPGDGLRLRVVRRCFAHCPVAHDTYLPLTFGWDALAPSERMYSVHTR